MHMYMYMYMYMHMYMYMYLYMYMYMYMYIDVCICIQIPIELDTDIHAMYIWWYMCIYIYTYCTVLSCLVLPCSGLDRIVLWCDMMWCDACMHACICPHLSYISAISALQLDLYSWGHGGVGGWVGRRCQQLLSLLVILVHDFLGQIWSNRVLISGYFRCTQ